MLHLAKVSSIYHKERNSFLNVSLEEINIIDEGTHFIFK